MSLYTTSKPSAWNSPRPYSDPSLRRHHYGKIEPMQDEYARHGINVRRELIGTGVFLVMLGACAFATAAMF